MTPIRQVPITSLPLARFAPVLRRSQWREIEDAVGGARELLRGRTVWNVSSTEHGGGVAELLRSLLGYARGAGVDARWVVIEGDTEFFALTKRLHNDLHGSAGASEALGSRERELYERTLERNVADLRDLVRAGDIVLLHDPQTAGLAPHLKDLGAHVAWRCHIGRDLPDELARSAWQFLLPYVRAAQTCVFSRPEYAWEGLAPEQLAFILPSIDPLAVKNAPLAPRAVHAILVACGLLDATTVGAPVFTREDGSPGRVDRRVELVEDARLALSTPTVVQVSRWDRLKDPVGVIEGFAAHAGALGDAHLVLAGPDTQAVADDPEGAVVLEESRAAWRALAPAVRARVHLACLPMADSEENAAIVNALQRHARVVCQKSIAEGFGLTVAEAMWKGRPVVASRVGGIQDQIEDGVSGILIDDPRDLDEFGTALARLLGDRELAQRMGVQARRRVRDGFLGPRHLIEYVELFGRLIGGAPLPPAEGPSPSK